VHNLDPDTVISDNSFDSALFATGAVLKGVDLVFNKEIDNAFCLVRPPGHHAREGQAMGFCIFNNIAIGARYLQTKYKLNRIIIIDWDAHHGNGTEEIFYEDRTIFYISLHQYPHYPGTGAKEDIGRGQGEGYNLNIPMKAGSGDNEYIRAFQDIIIPRLKSYKPEFILISAGFDGHRDDPLSGLNLTETGYYEMTKLVKEIARLYSENRIVSVLEGGYNLLSLSNSVYSHLLSLITLD
jgi:acetoin utilization deacetylase AcuC-like enzyme